MRRKNLILRERNQTVNKETVLVVGLGEIGRSIYEILKETEKFFVYGFDVNHTKMRDIKQENIPETIKVMHICFPCFKQNEFINTVKRYKAQYKPHLIIINSTIPPGTTEKINKQNGYSIVHSPIRGMHKNLQLMIRDLKFWTKYIGGTDKESSEMAQQHFEKAGFKTRILSGSIETELAKLFETTYRAWMIACFQEMHRITNHFNAVFDDVVDLLEDVHRVRFDRPVMFPDVIGGHCLIPNTKLLLRSYDSMFLHLILESNELRKKEVQNTRVKEEIDQIKKRTQLLEKEIMKRFVEDD